jgi:hypothetical protein
MSAVDAAATALLSRLAALGLTLPLAVAGDDDPGSVMDAAGLEVITIDVLGTMPHDECQAVAAEVVAIINRAAGMSPITLENET